MFIGNTLKGLIKWTVLWWNCPVLRQSKNFPAVEIERNSMHTLDLLLNRKTMPPHFGFQCFDSACITSGWIKIIDFNNEFNLRKATMPPTIKIRGCIKCFFFFLIPTLSSTKTNNPAEENNVLLNFLGVSIYSYLFIYGVYNPSSSFYSYRMHKSFFLNTFCTFTHSSLY